MENKIQETIIHKLKEIHSLSKILYYNEGETDIYTIVVCDEQVDFSQVLSSLYWDILEEVNDFTLSFDLEYVLHNCLDAFPIPEEAVVLYDKEQALSFIG